jgi:Lon protease-like protein
MQDDVKPHTGTLPDIIPVFPLDGVLLLPRGQLPLNIFEPRYLAMVEDALQSHRLIGMVQPRKNGEGLYTIGCAGKITSFNETEDHRYLITLTGASRFRIGEELPQQRGYRRVKADWAGFESDLKSAECINLDRVRLRKLLSGYFPLHGLSCEWDIIDGATDDRLITCLSMICPFEACEKQALLEASGCKSRADMFMAMLELAVHGGELPDGPAARH